MPPASSARPAPPSGLSEAARALWAALVDEFEWTPSDLALLTLGLETIDRRSQCREQIAAEGIVLTTSRGGMKPHPLLRVERDATLAVLAIFRQLGLSAPAANDKLGAA